MQLLRNQMCCGTNLRLKCIIIGYLNLLACVVDIGCHLLILSIITKGFQCDVGFDSLRSIDWPWLEPLLLIVNIGTHGFYPFPMVLRFHDSIPIEYLPISEDPQCYPGMLHLHLVDVLDLTINVIYLKFVFYYLIAVYKKEKDNIQMFFGLSLAKLFLQLMYFLYQPGFHSSFIVEGYWFIKVVDILVAMLFLIIIHKYIKQLKMEKAQKDELPTYIETLMNDASMKVKNNGEKTNNETVVAVLGEKQETTSGKKQEN